MLELYGWLTGDGAIIAHISYALLILSMLMDRMIYLRLLALGSGVTGILYLWLFLGERLASLWEFLFVFANLVQLGLYAWRNRRANFSSDETFFRDTVVPGLDPSGVRSLLRIGEFRDIAPGTELTHESETVRELVFLIEGEVAITVCGQTVAHCGRGQFVGEIGISSGAPATATAIVTAPSRILAFDGEELRGLVRKQREIGRELELAYRGGLREKLVRANQVVAGLGNRESGSVPADAVFRP